MITILFTFIIALVLSLSMTPVARWLCIRYGIVDKPAERKVHNCAMPRSGGAAIFLTFFLALIASAFLMTETSDLLAWNDERLFGVLGAVVVFGVGLCDDIRRLGHKIKFLMQIVAASLAFYGGLRIETIGLNGFEIPLGLMSYFVTVFWFLLFINAVNLIDGLDGLAAGVVFFACTVMAILSFMRSDYLSAIEFAALGGALLGFLRYNFNPASIFMGDGGSYFVGYTIAALAILGSIKSQVGATLLIPLIALGVPIFDTILSPVRRFIRGRRMFDPDKGHIHHRLLIMGFSSRKAVLIIYSASAILCVASILIVQARDVWAGFLLAGVGAGSYIFVRKRNYMEYLAIDKIFGWLRDVSDVTGLSQERRSFLSLQIDMNQSENMDKLWGNVCQALEKLRFDRGEIHLNGGNGRVSSAAVPSSAESGRQPGPERRNNGGNENSCSNDSGMLHLKTKDGDGWICTRKCYRRATDTSSNHLLKIEIPLGNGNGSLSGKLVLFKDIKREPLQPYTLMRVEHLRRTMESVLKKITSNHGGQVLLFSVFRGSTAPCLKEETAPSSKEKGV